MKAGKPGLAPWEEPGHQWGLDTGCEWLASLTDSSLKKGAQLLAQPGSFLDQASLRFPRAARPHKVPIPASTSYFCILLGKDSLRVGCCAPPLSWWLSGNHKAGARAAISICTSGQPAEKRRVTFPSQGWRVARLMPTWQALGSDPTLQAAEIWAPLPVLVASPLPLLHAPARGWEGDSWGPRNRGVEGSCTGHHAELLRIGALGPKVKVLRKFSRHGFLRKEREGLPTRIPLGAPPEAALCGMHAVGILRAGLGSYLCCSSCVTLGSR